MAQRNQDIVKKFFAAYAKHDIAAIREVMDENVVWHFPGSHPFAGVKSGIEEVVAFFDAMAEIMGRAKMNMEKLIEAENEDHFIECQHSSATREDGISLDHFSCVLWTIKNGKITEGRHFFAGQQAVDNYFTAVGPKSPPPVERL
jgi:uncharacterized protein